jgi:lipopolysaccharide heptosyltransferase II
MAGEDRRIRCIAVFHVNQIGDMIFSLPLLANLRHRYPRARIVSVLRPHLREIWDMAGLGDEFLIRDRTSRFRGFLPIVRALRKRSPDLCVVQSQTLEPALLARLSGAPERVGFRIAWWDRFLLTRVVPKDTPPSVANNLRLGEAAGAPSVRKDYVGLLRPPAGERIRMMRRLAEHRVSAHTRLIVLAPGASAGRALKLWTDEGFAAVADHFAAQPGTAVAFAGGESLSGIVSRVSHPVLDFSGATTLPELAALLDRADLLISVDSGPLHMAAAMATPVVGIYGPTDPALTGPMGIGHRVVRFGVPCSPCHLKECSIGRICMQDLPPSAVIQAAEEILAATRSAGDDWQSARQ